MVSILDAPDDRFRIFSWHIPLNDGSYLYYGTIQLNTPDGSLKMYPLLDKTYEITEPEQAVTAPDNWYGPPYSIGRASGRESVGQYFQISSVAGYLTKKQRRSH